MAEAVTRRRRRDPYRGVHRRLDDLAGGADGDSAAERVNVGLVRDWSTPCAGPAAGPVVFAGATSQAGRPAPEVLTAPRPTDPRGVRPGRSCRRCDPAGRPRGGVVSGPPRSRLPTSSARDRPPPPGTGRGVADGAPRVGRPGHHHVATTARYAATWCTSTTWARAWWRPRLRRGAGRRAGYSVAGNGCPPGEVSRRWPSGRKETGQTRCRVVPGRRRLRRAGDFRSVTVDSSAFRAVTGLGPQVPPTRRLRVRSSTRRRGDRRDRGRRPTAAR